MSRPLFLDFAGRRSAPSFGDCNARDGKVIPPPRFSSATKTLVRRISAAGLSRLGGLPTKARKSKALILSARPKRKAR